MRRKNSLKRYSALLLALGMLSCGVQSAWAEAASEAQTETESEAQTAEQTEAETEAPLAFFTEETGSDSIISGMEDAAAVVENMAERIGADGEIQFEPWRTITDSRGNNYYVFRQMYGDVTVSGGAVKVVTDSTGRMLGLVSSVETQLPETQTQEGITSGEAEKIVQDRMRETGHPGIQVVEGYTEKTILPVNLELDPYSEEEKEEVRYVWVIYTNNEKDEKENILESSELPYLAHYVTMDGEYLYSLPTVIPNDEAGNTGFQASYVFEFMEPADYTGTVTLSDGKQQEISIQLMRDSRTGMYYLGNLERRIVVADCYEFLYNKGQVVLEASADNTGWDNTCLLALYNYCRAWDYYDAIGWKGGDGLGTPMIILKDFCDKDHNPVNNAAYAGSYYGWQLFLSSSANDFSQCLDVLAHEFTHCVTGSVMTWNAYSNDYGAINEAISDIQGNLCEMMMGATEDTTWELGEQGANPVRSMGDPHNYRQPEFTWDMYYVPNVRIPTDMNDRGGVHSNSSLLNRIAYLLCTEGGMSYEEAREFWFAVDCSMVPATDYAQLGELLPWVLSNTGLEKYHSSLQSAISETGICDKEMPEDFGPDRALVTLELPDTESFKDGNWSLYILSVDTEELRQRINGILHKEGEYAGALEELDEMLQDALWKYVFEGAGDAAFDKIRNEWIPRYFKGVLYLGSGAAGADGRTVQMVCTPGYTIPFLMYMKFEPNQLVPTAVGFAIYTKGRWVDLMDQVIASADHPEAATEAVISWINDEETPFFYEIEGGRVCRIPADGLEEVKPYDGDMLDSLLPGNGSQTPAD